MNLRDQLKNFEELEDASGNGGEWLYSAGGDTQEDRDFEAAAPQILQALRVSMMINEKLVNALSYAEPLARIARVNAVDNLVTEALDLAKSYGVGE